MQHTSMQQMQQMQKNCKTQTPKPVLQRRVKPQAAAVALVMLSSTLLLNNAQAHGDDDPLLTMVKIDQLEWRDGSHDHPLVLEGDAWIGYDLNKLWIKADAEQVGSALEDAELQALYSRAIAPFWDLQLGVRHDFKPEPERTWAVFGVQGIAPYFFNTDAALFVGESGRTALRLNTEYELMLTQRWVLVPEIELNFYGQNDAETGAGSGLANAEFGLRLRYEIRREIAPYVGVNWNHRFGNTADYARADNAPVTDGQWVAGISVWF